MSSQVALGRGGTEVEEELVLFAESPSVAQGGWVPSLESPGQLAVLANAPETGARPHTRVPGSRHWERRGTSALTGPQGQHITIPKRLASGTPSGSHRHRLEKEPENFWRRERTRPCLGPSGRGHPAPLCVLCVGLA